MSDARYTRFPWLKYLIAFLVIAIVAVSPIVIAVGTLFFAHALGCEVDEKIVNSCTILGVDWGFALYFAGVLLWYAAFPFLIFGIFGYAIWLISLLFEIGIFRLRKRSFRDAP